MLLPVLNARSILSLLVLAISFATPSFAASSVYDFSLPSIDGQPTSLSTYSRLLPIGADRCRFWGKRSGAIGTNRECGAGGAGVIGSCRAKGMGDEEGEGGWGVSFLYQW